MVYHRTGLDVVFAALADPTRRAIIARLTAGERTIGELAARFDMTLPAVSKHVRVLERAGLARVRRDGRARRAALVAEPMREAAEWIERHRRFWEHQLDRLAAYLNPDDTETPTWPAPPAPRRPRSRSAAPSRRRASGSSAPGPARKKSGAGARRGR